MKSFYQQHRYRIYVLALMALMAALAVVFHDALPALLPREQVQAAVQSQGLLGPIILVLITMAEVIIAPIPGTILPIIGGGLFGPWGAIYIWIGNVLGSLVAFILARQFGPRLVQRLAPSFNQAEYHEQMRWLWIFYFLPIVPLDILSFAYGLSKMRLRSFFWRMAIGYAFSMTLLTLFGDVLFRAIT